MMAYCDDCDRYFNTHHALRQHLLNSSLHNYCGDCEIDFSSFKGLKEHWVQSRYHDYCQYCDEHFQDEEDLEEHYEDCHYYCPTCRRVFRSEYGLTEHYRQSPAHHYCASCDRLFRSESNLNTHLRSSIHCPKDVICPGCQQGFVSRSAMILHLEAGTCRSGLNRKTIDRIIQQYDRNHIITDPSRLLTGSVNVEYSATDAAWNGYSYECYFCHNTYRTLLALNQHLASPRHQAKIYICPLNTCKLRCSTLSGLCQHIESEKCGVFKFRAVREAMDDLVNGMKRIAFH
ncbi:hypothetical protein BD779DRAFT_1488197 [Infundibulicybe gibba]|nr:hypothetical protein BD779DRAFT_1488197 [Infundibulicybe gibba]